MKCVVTGAGGLIGWHLWEGLLQAGHPVRGLDAFIPYSPRAVKEVNLAVCRAHRGFELKVADLRTDPLADHLADAEVVFHLAAMPGLPRSWTDFDLYEGCNVTATQRVLESVRGSTRLKRFIYASTSSVYGRYGSG